jgi:hypothetical protein
MSWVTGFPHDRSGFRKERLGLLRSHHRRMFAESIITNVGGPRGEGGSPPKKRMGVGAIRVVGGWESQPQGEEWQPVGKSKAE